MSARNQVLSGSRRSLPLYVLLLSTLVLAGILGFQAYDSARSHRATAQQTLRDYAQLANWRYQDWAYWVLEKSLADAFSPLGYNWGSYFVGLVDDFSLWQGILPAEDRDGDPTNDILSMWGSWICPDGAQPPLDFDGDCVVNIGDLAAIGEEWMVCGRRPLDMCD